MRVNGKRSECSFCDVCNTLFNSLRWPISIFNLVDITKLPCYPHQCSITVSLELSPLIHVIAKPATELNPMYIVILASVILYDALICWGILYDVLVTYNSTQVIF